MIRFSCPGCGTPLSADSSAAGKTTRCTLCQATFQVPHPDGQEPQPGPASSYGGDWAPDYQERKTGLLMVSVAVVGSVFLGVFLLVVILRPKEPDTKALAKQNPAAPHEDFRAPDRPAPRRPRPNGEEPDVPPLERRSNPSRPGGPAQELRPLSPEEAFPNEPAQPRQAQPNGNEEMAPVAPEKEAPQKPDPEQPREVEPKAPLARPGPDQGQPAPEESVETQALLSQCLANLASRNPKDRIQAAKTLGILGPKALSARRPLIKALLDLNRDARTAAADALLKVDPAMQALALRIVINSDVEAVREVGRLKEDGEPYIPIVLNLGKKMIQPSSGNSFFIHAIMVTLASIGKEDKEVNEYLLGLFNHPDHGIRDTLVLLAPGLKHAKLALKPLLTMVRTEGRSTRINAMAALLSIADENSEGIIRKTLEAMRYDADPNIRQAVKNALDKLAAR